MSDEIIGNCDVTLGLGTTDILTAQFFCDLIGVSTAETTSLKVENSLEGEIGGIWSKKYFNFTKKFTK